MPRKSTLDPQVKALLDNLNFDAGDDESLPNLPKTLPNIYAFCTNA